LKLIEHEVVRYHDAPPVSMVSEAGWSLIQFPEQAAWSQPAVAPSATAAVNPPSKVDPFIALLEDLRSSDAERVAAALGDTASFTRVHVAQTIDLLAWDAMLPVAREALERLAPDHLGMLVDAMLNPATDFVVRRRVPRILGAVPTRRSLEELVNGLDDKRFEVRYHCSRAINRILAKNPELSVDPARVIAIVERELEVPPQRWRGYTLLDRPELEGPSEADTAPEHSSRYVEYLTVLLSTFIQREPLDAAVQGVVSEDPGVRGLAQEYLNQVLPDAVLKRLRALIASTT
jgi:HEAT repeat protein